MRCRLRIAPIVDRPPNKSKLPINKWCNVTGSSCKAILAPSELPRVAPVATHPAVSNGTLRIRDNADMSTDGTTAQTAVPCTYWWFGGMLSWQNSVTYDIANGNPPTPIKELIVPKNNPNEICWYTSAGTFCWENHVVIISSSSIVDSVSLLMVLFTVVLFLSSTFSICGFVCCCVCCCCCFVRRVSARCWIQKCVGMRITLKALKNNARALLDNLCARYTVPKRAEMTAGRPILMAIGTTTLSSHKNLYDAETLEKDNEDNEMPVAANCE